MKTSLEAKNPRFVLTHLVGNENEIVMPPFFLYIEKSAQDKMANVLDCDILVSEFEIHSSYLRLLLD